MTGETMRGPYGPKELEARTVFGLVELYTV